MGNSLIEPTEASKPELEAEEEDKETELIRDNSKPLEQTEIEADHPLALETQSQWLKVCR